MSLLDGRSWDARQSNVSRCATHHFRFARHEHKVINAVRTSIGNSAVVIPPPVANLIKAIPTWLYPSVEVIDGDIIRERIIERDTGVEDWRVAQVDDEPIVDWEMGRDHRALRSQRLGAARSGS